MRISHGITRLANAEVWAGAHSIFYAQIVACSRVGADGRRSWSIRICVLLLLAGCGGAGDSDGHATSTAGPSETAGKSTTPALSRDPNVSVGPAPFLDVVLEIIRGNAYYADNLDWQQWENDADLAAANAQSTDATYGFVRDLVAALDDGHSRFFTAVEVEKLTEPSTRTLPAQSAPFGEVDANRIGYLSIPGFNSADMTSTEVTKYIEAAFAVLDQPACGWIIDLAGNQGGSLFPMLAALAPILGPGEAIGYSSRDGATDMYEITDHGSLVTNTGVELVAAPTSFPGFLHSNSPVAVLQGRQTASSGEGALIALRGHGATSFGRPTQGVPTGNQLQLLPDGSAINHGGGNGTQRHYLRDRNRPRCRGLR